MDIEQLTFPPNCFTVKWQGVLLPQSTPSFCGPSAPDPTSSTTEIASFAPWKADQSLLICCPCAGLPQVSSRIQPQPLKTLKPTLLGEVQVAARCYDFTTGSRKAWPRVRL